jgi:hypothetical protein
MSRFASASTALRRSASAAPQNVVKLERRPK